MESVTSTLTRRVSTGAPQQSNAYELYRYIKQYSCVINQHLIFLTPSRVVIDLQHKLSYCQLMARSQAAHKHKLSTADVSAETWPW